MLTSIGFDDSTIDNVIVVNGVGQAKLLLIMSESNMEKMNLSVGETASLYSGSRGVQNGSSNATTTATQNGRLKSIPTPSGTIY